MADQANPPRPVSPRTRARELRLQRLLGEDERGRRIQQQSEERLFVTALNREVLTIRAQRLRGDSTRAKQVDARARREGRRAAALEALNGVERKLHLARTGRDGKIEGAVPHTTANGSLKAPAGTSPRREGRGEGDSPPRPLLPLNDVSSHKRVFEPSQHLLPTPRTSPSAYLPTVSPRRTGGSDAGNTSPEAPAEETKQEAEKRRLMCEAAQRVLTLHKKREDRVQRSERTTSEAAHRQESAQQRFGRAN
uniref:Uncharacterized protein n=1 Tax=Neobodo designis TaxID=312471 RepID=A0A7S1M1D1_NEODS|mmetsp:Transcript_32431/g.100323  ORF Transcript_32431/g.100323 Transcript_32431/m.100323 type:complete len:251 (+) Transcript_32431:36-788(+)